MYYLYLIFQKIFLQLTEQWTYQEPQFCRLLLKIPWWFPCEPGWAVSAFSELPCSRALVSSLILQYLCPPLPPLSLGRHGEGRLDGAVHKHLLTLFRNCLHIWINNLWKKSLVINGLFLKLHFFIVLQVRSSISDWIWRGSRNSKGPRDAVCRPTSVWICPSTHQPCPSYGLNSPTAL